MAPDALAPVPDERVQLRLRRLRRHPVLQTADEIEKVASAVLTIGRVQPEGHPDLGAVVHDVGAGRHHADDFAAQAIDLDHLSDHRTSVKCGLPQLVRQNHDARRRRRRLSWRGRRAADVGFSLREQSSVRRLDSERVEQVLVDVCGTHAKRSIAGDEVRLARRERADGRKGAVELAELHVFRRRDPELGEPERRKLRRQVHQPIGLRIPERPQDDAVDDRENRGVGADAERERQHGHGGEAGSAPQHAQPMTHIARHVVEPRGRADRQSIREAFLLIISQLVAPVEA